MDGIIASKPNGDIATTPKRAENPPLKSLTPNPALHVDQNHKIYMADSPALTPSSTDCIIHVHANGICGSDLHFWHAGSIGDLIVHSPHCLGHEGAGTIVWAGSDVHNFRIGDRVAIEPGVPCERCYNCSVGEYNLCADVKFSGVPPHAGSIRRYHVHSARYLHRLPAELSFGDGALLEPLSVVAHAFERSHVRLGEPVLIAGAGPIGLIALAAARASGAFPIVITDVDAARLRFAKAFVKGCTTVLVPVDKSAEEVAGLIQKAFEDMASPPPRVSYECTGVASSVHTVLYATQRGGEIMVIGVGRKIMDGVPFMHASMAEIDMKFINRYHHQWPYAIRLLQSGYIDLKPLVTHTFDLESAVQAMETASDRSKESIKVHILDDKK
ncbi:hypothetical protein MBLNU457_4796t1 [Dothideomycetes sp. NU457]